MRIYVGNLSYDATDEDLRQAFGAYGQISSVDVIKDRFSGQPKGFAVIEMSAKAEAESAISALNGTEIRGRKVNVSEARPRPQGGGGGGGGGGRERGGGGRSRY